MTGRGGRGEPVCPECYGNRSVLLDGVIPVPCPECRPDEHGEAIARRRVHMRAKAVTMTFSELCHGCTPDEREALAWHLGMIRMRNTVRALGERQDGEPRNV